MLRKKEHRENSKQKSTIPHIHIFRYIQDDPNNLSEGYAWNSKRKCIISTVISYMYVLHGNKFFKHIGFLWKSNVTSRKKKEYTVYIIHTKQSNSCTRTWKQTSYFWQVNHDCKHTLLVRKNLWWELNKCYYANEYNNALDKQQQK